MIVDLQLDQFLCHRALSGAGVETLDGLGAVSPRSGEVLEEIIRGEGIEPGEGVRRIHYERG
jgi:hypothetical protein